MNNKIRRRILRSAWPERSAGKHGGGKYTTPAAVCELPPPPAATWVTFLPCFWFILLGGPHIERLGDMPRASAALTAAVVGPSSTSPSALPATPSGPTRKPPAGSSPPSPSPPSSPSPASNPASSPSSPPAPSSAPPVCSDSAPYISAANCSGSITSFCVATMLLPATMSVNVFRMPSCRNRVAGSSCGCSEKFARHKMLCPS